MSSVYREANASRLGSLGVTRVNFNTLLMTSLVLVLVTVDTSWSPEDAFSQKPALQGTLRGEYSYLTWLFFMRLF